MNLHGAAVQSVTEKSRTVPVSEPQSLYGVDDEIVLIEQIKTTSANNIDIVKFLSENNEEIKLNNEIYPSNAVFYFSLITKLA